MSRKRTQPHTSSVSGSINTGIDYLVVGAGMAGLTCAQQLSEAGKRVICIDKREYVGGNCADFYNEHGVLQHRFGPHMFHTNSRKVYDYLSRFTEWIPGNYRAVSVLEDREVCFPPNLRTYEQQFSCSSSSENLEAWLQAQRIRGRDPNSGNLKAWLSNHPPGPATNFEEAVVRKVGREWYERLYEGYTRKMWGLEPTELLPELSSRIPLRTNYDDSYFRDAYQLMPSQGYTRMFERMAAAKNLFVVLNCTVDELDFTADHIVWTGAVDEYFGYMYGPLPYRTLDFKAETRNVAYAQNQVLRLFPDVNVPHTRTVEVKHITGQKCLNTTVVTETPRQYERSTDERLYPMPTASAKLLYNKYALVAEKFADNVTFLGRLGTYQYLNMDQACAAALAVSQKFLAR